MLISPRPTSQRYFNIYQRWSKIECFLNMIMICSIYWTRFNRRPSKKVLRNHVLQIWSWYVVFMKSNSLRDNKKLLKVTFDKSRMKQSNRRHSRMFKANLWKKWHEIRYIKYNHDMSCLCNPIEDNQLKYLKVLYE